jgi:mono/diheme cytochrome c family protein
MLALLITASAGACDQPPVREWRPEDHGQERPRAGSTQTAPAEDDKPVSAEEAEARATLALWNVTCSTCHARDGRGGGPGLPPGAKVPDLTDPGYASTRSDEQLATSIREGKNMMPAFGVQLGPTGVAVMVKHVRKLSAPAPP